MVIGSRSFVNEIFTTLKDRFGEKRKTGARLMRGLEKQDKLYALRDLSREWLGEFREKMLGILCPVVSCNAADTIIS